LALVVQAGKERLPEVVLAVIRCFLLLPLLVVEVVEQ
jgi:hypothetical protein